VKTYDLRSDWRVRATVDEVLAVMGDPTDLPRWWPMVYLDANVLDPGEPETGVGKRIAIHARGFLPYTLQFELRVTENRIPRGISVAVCGDLEGEGHWHVAEEPGGVVHLQHVWLVRPAKPLVRRLSFMLRPLFEANHHWTMTQGLRCLERELEARRA
jgi:hypothetical protein